jgi:hypothetical protein
MFNEVSWMLDDGLAWNEDVKEEKVGLEWLSGVVSFSVACADPG